MKRQILILVVTGILLGSGIVLAKSDEEIKTSQADEQHFKTIVRDEQNRKVDQLSRSTTNLERKVDRLEDRLERLDEDFKEFKRNQSSKKSDGF